MRTLVRFLLLSVLLSVPAFGQTPCQKCGRIHTPVADPVPNAPLMPGEINRDQRAYDFAKQEAWRVARHVNGNGRRLPGHHLGVAPGCRAAGTGNGFLVGVPVHCRPYRDSRIVARACVVYRGRVCWAAMYR